MTARVALGAELGGRPASHSDSLSRTGSSQKGGTTCLPSGYQTTDEPRFSDQWALENTDQAGGTTVTGIDAPDNRSCILPTALY